MSRSGKSGRPPHDDQLTPAEWRTVEGVRHGLSNSAIAKRLGVTTDAVKFHVANALGKLGFSSRAELRRWVGVRKDSALGRRAEGEGEGAVRSIGQIARIVSDVEASVRWYQDVLGLRHLYTYGNLGFVQCGETRLLLTTGDRAQNSILYLSTDNILVAHARLLERGVEIVAAPHRIHRHDDGSEEWMCFFRDPDGGILALMAVIEAEGDVACETD